MCKPSIYVIAKRFIPLLGFVLVGGSLINCRTAQKPKTIIPNENWVPLLFETRGLSSKSINEITSEAGLPSLRTVVLPNDDMEIRIWVGFGLQGVDGLILRRISSEWSGIHLHGMAERPPFPSFQQRLDVPKSGWQTLWQQLRDAGILTLPDGASLQCDPGGKDGTSYVVETNTRETYRTYSYHDPDYAKCEQAKQMVKIGEIIAEEFGFNEFRIKH